MNLQEKLLQHYIGFSNPRDEYQKSEIYRVLSNGTFYIFGLVTLSLLISLGWDVHFEKFSVATPILFIIQSFIFLFPTFKGNQIKKENQTIYTESYDEKHYSYQINLLKKQIIYSSIYIFSAIIVLSSYFNALIDNHSPRLDIFDIVGSVAETAILATAIYFLGKLMFSKKF